MPTKLRVVLDTNVIISGLISPKGPPAGILKALKAGRFILLTNQAINEEILEVMDRPRLRDKYGLADHMFDIAFILWDQAEVIPKPPLIKASRDPDDDKFLACALASGVTVVISGDKDLLEQSGWRTIRVLRPRQFVDEFLGSR